MNILAPLGVINPNFEYLVVDQDMKTVKNGEKGELCLVGSNVALGYYYDPTRTAENFVQNPNIKTHRDIIYKCGDIVYEKDGLLWFAGRIDNQIKHMGYRIELEEIEAALNGLEYIVHSAVVYERTTLNYGKIIASVVIRGNLSESQIKDDIGDFLPEYMLPNIIKIVGELPRNSNGKIDRVNIN